DVAMILDILDARLVAKPGFVLDVPLAFRFVLRLCRQQRRLRGQVEDLVIAPRSLRSPERRWLLAVGVATAAVVSHFAWPKLMPGLGHVEDHAVLVEGLEGEGYFGGNLGEKAGVEILVGIVPLFTPVEVTQRNLAEDAQPFAGVAEEALALLEAAMAIGRRFH